MQIVWWWSDWRRPGFTKFDGVGLARLYRWSAWGGPIEIRRWARFGHQEPAE